MKILFPVSGIETYWFLPPLIMMSISSIVSPAGVSGAFILLPLQISFFNYTSPGVSATNFIYNIVSIPLGIARHIKTKTLSWNLFFLLLGGTLPGIFLGYYIRIVYLPTPQKFKIFVACVLLFLGVKTLISAWKETHKSINRERLLIKKELLSVFRGEIILKNSKIYTFSPLCIVFASLIVGVIGGAYGIGGGALMAPFLISVLNLPPMITSGATLFSTWCTSVVAALFYAFGPKFGTSINSAPDLLLGTLFGIGGMIGIFLGTKLRSYMSDRWIKIILGCALLFITYNYLKPLILGKISF